MHSRRTSIFIVALALPTLAACVDAGRPLVILQAQVPDTGMGGCTVPNKRTALRLFQGVLDVALDRPRPYYLYPEISNRLPALSGMAGGSEPNRIDVVSLQVRIEPPPGLAVTWPAECPVSFDWANPLTLFPGDEAPGQVEALRACHAAKIRELFDAGKLDPNIATDVRFRVLVSVKGKHGGTQITSDPFEFPIRVCYGCLQTGFGDAQFAPFNFQNGKVAPCKQLMTNPYQGNVCNPAQDLGPVLCCSVDGTDKTIECPGIPRAVMP